MCICVTFHIGVFLQGDISDSGKLEVAFSKGTWNFWAESLILYELQLGAFVRWQKIDEDVKKGDLGQVVGIKVSEGRLRVQFPKGQWKFKANDLSLFRIQPGLGGSKMLKSSAIVVIYIVTITCTYNSTYYSYSYSYIYMFVAIMYNTSSVAYAHRHYNYYHLLF